MFKTCRKCGAEKPLDAFYRDRSVADGHRNSCMDCDKAHDHSPEVLERKRGYNNSEKGQAAQKRHRDSGKKWETQKVYRSDPIRIERIKEYHREYHREYYYSPQYQAWLKDHLSDPALRDYIKRRKAKWMQSPIGREKVRAQGRRNTHKRNAALNNLPANYTEQEWQICLAFFDHRCAYCGCSGPLEQDHFVPLSLGGPYTRDNIVPACKLCNVRKHDTAPDLWCPPETYAHVQSYFRSIT